MKPTLLLFLVLGAAASGISTAHASKVLLAQADTAKIAQVKAGTLKTANASWWGFNKDDATDCLQNAISSGVPKLIVDNTGSDWIINKPLQLVSNQTIIFSDGVVIQAKKDCFHGKNDSLFVARNLTNLTMQGKGKVILRMRKADYEDPAKYSRAEWRHGINLRECTNVVLRNLTVTETGGDGLYLGASPKGANKNVLLEDMIFDANHRLGMAVISADGLTIRHSKFINTLGTNPNSGIDFEPNYPGQLLKNIVLEDCVFSKNEENGIAIAPFHLDGTSEPISITFKHCVISGNTTGVVGSRSLTVNSLARGNVTFDNCIFDHDQIGLSSQIVGGVHYLFKDSTQDFSNVKGYKTASWRSLFNISAENLPAGRAIGNVTFDDFTILTDNNAPISLKFSNTVPIADNFFNGTVFIQRSDGRKIPIDLKSYAAKVRLEQSNPVLIFKEQFSNVEVTDISKSWHFLPDPAKGQDVTSLKFDDSSWKTIDGGHRMWWQKQGYSKYHGVAWYRKTVTVPQISKGQKVILYFKGVDGNAQVYVNGKKMGKHILGKDIPGEAYSGWDQPFQFDISRVIHAGKNIIAVQVTSKNQNSASGINESVYLVVGKPVN